MCGRFADHLEWEERWARILGEWPNGVEMSFNRTPTQQVASFTPDGGFAMRWGLVPAWSKEPKTKYSTINAVLETVASKPLFRGAWKEGRRCLLPILGYYEWKSEGGVKQPYLIRNADDTPLFLGGLWEFWQREKESLLSCTILTRKPIAQIEHIHNRMPVVIPVDQLTAWLEVSADEAKAMAENATPKLEHYPVNRYVNNARNDGPKCVERDAG